jgi:hypothetical protein
MTLSQSRFLVDYWPFGVWEKAIFEHLYGVYVVVVTGENTPATGCFGS